MAIQTWPETIFPLPSVSFNVDADFSNIRSNMDSGRVRQRRRFSQETELASATFELTRVQYAAWKGFWVHRVNRGNDWFSMRLPIADGANLTNTEIRFASDYKAQHRHGGNWDVSVTIEFKETSQINEDLLELLILDGQNSTAFQIAVDALWEECEHFESEHSFN